MDDFIYRYLPGRESLGDYYIKLATMLFTL